MIRLAANDLSVSFGEICALEALSIEAAAGEVIGLIGPNGAGKSTLLRALAGLVPAAGSVLIDGEPAFGIGRRARARLISYLPQHVDAGWPVTVREVVSLGRDPHIAAFGRQGADDIAAVRSAMTACDIEHLAERPATMLSAGERARTMMARALAVEAPILLADEPTAALDPFHQLSVMEMLREYAGKDRLVLAALHDLTLAARYCDRLILIDGGHLIADGSVDAVLSESNLRDVYKIEAKRGRHGDVAFILPWRRHVAEDTRRRVSET